MQKPAIEMNNALLTASYRAGNSEMPEGLEQRLTDVFQSEDNLLKKMAILDSLVDEYKIDSEVGELMFDVLLYNFFSEDSQRLGESYFDSKEWEKIEAVIIDRGTEMMNILLYIHECKDSGIQFSMDDYLDEYLIAEDDFGQEEYEVYEAIIKNRESISDGNLENLIEISKSNSSSPLHDQLLPILLFFETKTGIDKKFEIIIKTGKSPSFQCAFLAALDASLRIEIQA